jgi:hypothetical protein
MAKVRQRRRNLPPIPPIPQGPPLGSGPHLSAALIAERVLTEQDSVPSIVRVVDKVGINPVKMKDSLGIVGIPLTIWVSFKGDGFKGERPVVFVQVSPSDKRQPIGFANIQFDGSKAKGFNVIIPTVLKWEGPGQYWYDVYLGDKFCTRMPLEVVIGDITADEKKKKQ